MDAWRRDGVWKLVWPASRPLPLSLSLCTLAASIVSPATEVAAADMTLDSLVAAERRKGTFDSMLDLDLSLVATSSVDGAGPARSLPFASGTVVARSSVGCWCLEPRILLVVRRVFSRDVRRRLNVLGLTSEGVVDDDGWELLDGLSRDEDTAMRREVDASGIDVDAI